MIYYILAEGPGVAREKKNLSVHKKFQPNRSNRLAGYRQNIYIYDVLFYYIEDVSSKPVWFVTLSNTLKFCFTVVFLFHCFLDILLPWTYISLPWVNCVRWFTQQVGRLDENVVWKRNKAKRHRQLHKLKADRGG